MATLAELQDRRDALARKRASGERAVEIEGRRVEFKTDSEMGAAIAFLDREIARMQATPVHSVIITGTKGI